METDCKGACCCCMVVTLYEGNLCFEAQTTYGLHAQHTIGCKLDMHVKLTWICRASSALLSMASGLPCCC